MVYLEKSRETTEKLQILKAHARTHSCTNNRQLEDTRKEKTPLTMTATILGVKLNKSCSKSMLAKF